MYIYVAYKLNNNYVKTDNNQRIFQQRYPTLKMISPLKSYL